MKFSSNAMSVLSVLQFMHLPQAVTISLLLPFNKNVIFAYAADVK